MWNIILNVYIVHMVFIPTVGLLYRKCDDNVNGLITVNVCMYLKCLTCVANWSETRILVHSRRTGVSNRR